MSPRGRKAWNGSCNVSVCLTRDTSFLLEAEVFRITSLPLWNSAHVLQYGVSGNWTAAYNSKAVFSQIKRESVHLEMGSRGQSSVDRANYITLSSETVFSQELCDVLWKAYAFAITLFPLLAPRHWKLLFCGNHMGSYFEYCHLKPHQYKFLVLHS